MNESEILVDPEDTALLEAYRWQIDRGYVKRVEKRNGKARVIYLHRELLAASAGVYVDHINGNRSDNRRSNIRIVTGAENGQNRPTPARSNTGYRGVHWHARRKQWESHAIINDKRPNVSRFHRWCSSLEEAVRAAHEWRLVNMPGYIPDPKTLALLEIQ